MFIVLAEVLVSGAKPLILRVSREEGIGVLEATFDSSQIHLIRYNQSSLIHRSTAYHKRPSLRRDGSYSV
jgi:hypothetical protein